MMERYIRDFHSKVHPVKVVGAPEGEVESEAVSDISQNPMLECGKKGIKKVATNGYRWAFVWGTVCR